MNEVVCNSNHFVGLNFGRKRTTKMLHVYSEKWLDEPNESDAENFINQISNPIEHTIEPLNIGMCIHFPSYSTYIHGLNYCLIFDLLFFEANNQSRISKMFGIHGNKC